MGPRGGLPEASGVPPRARPDAARLASARAQVLPLHALILITDSLLHSPVSLPALRHTLHKLMPRHCSCAPPLPAPAAEAEANTDAIARAAVE